MRTDDGAREEERSDTRSASLTLHHVSHRRLVLTLQGDLVVGPAKLQANGLSKNFCLTGRDVAGDKEKAKSLLPSRVHIQKWFEME